MSKKTCQWPEGCDREALLRGLCNKHYKAAQRKGLFGHQACSIDGCDSTVYARGWCGKHYKRFRTHGDASYLPAGERPFGPCSVEGCERVQYDRTELLCQFHYQERRTQRLKEAARPCRIEGCGNPAIYKRTGLCTVHQSRRKRLGNATAVVRTWKYAPTDVCSAQDCDRKPRSSGLCARHYNLAYRYANIERYREHDRNKYLRDPEKYRRRSLERYRADPSNIQHSRRRRKARLRNAQGSHTKAEWEAKLAEFKGRCAYCGAPATTLDHLYPIARGGTDYIENIVPACRPCNSSKSDNTLREWLGLDVRPVNTRKPQRRGKAQSSDSR